MIFFNIIFFGYISAVLGGLHTKPDPITGEPINKVRRYLSLPACFIVLALNAYPDLIALVAWGWLFWCIRLFPTQALFTAVHCKIPKRDDWITKLVPIGYFSYDYGIIAGIIRTLPAFPSMLYIGNPFVAIFFSIGIFYYIAGWYGRKYNGKDNVRWAEMVIGGLFGLFLALERI